MKLRKLTLNEKLLISLAIMFVILIALNWKRVSQGVIEGFKPYFTEQKPWLAVFELKAQTFW